MQSGGRKKGTKVAIILINLPAKLTYLSISRQRCNKETVELHAMSHIDHYGRASSKYKRKISKGNIFENERAEMKYRQVYLDIWRIRCMVQQC